MKHILQSIALLVTTLFLPLAVSAAAPQGHQVTTTGDLIELCSVSADDPIYDAAMGFCLGYIDAALDYHAELTAGPGNDALTCPANSITREEVVTVVVEWSRRNPQYQNTETPVTGVMRAVTEKWPCSGQ